MLSSKRFILSSVLAGCTFLGIVAMVVIIAQANAAFAASPKGLLSRLRLASGTQTLRLSPSCPLTTETCVPCRLGDSACRVKSGQVYGFKGWSCQNNNPGNIRYSEDRNRIIVLGGGVPSCGEQSGYMVFSTYQNGRNSLKAYLRAISKGYHSGYPACGNCSLKYFFSRYAPAGDQNDPTSYANAVASAIGVSPDTTTLTWIVNNKLNEFVDAIQQHEGWFVQ